LFVCITVDQCVAYSLVKLVSFTYRQPQPQPDRHTDSLVMVFQYYLGRLARCCCCYGGSGAAR